MLESRAATHYGAQIRHVRTHDPLRIVQDLLPTMAMLLLLGWSLPSPVAAQQSEIEKGRAARAAGDLETAERHFRTALAAQPDNPDPALFLAIVLTARGNPDAALKVLSPFENRFPDYVGLHLARVRALAATGDIMAAEALAEELLSRTPDDAAVLSARARMHLRRGDPSAAEALYRRALDQAPSQRAALIGMIDVALQQQRPDIAQQRLEELAVGFPDDPALAPRRDRLADLRDSQRQWTLFTQYQLGAIGAKAGTRHRAVVDLTRETPRSVLRGRLQEERRRGDHDHLLTAHVTPLRDGRLTPTFRAALGPGNRFLPQYRLGAGVNWLARKSDGPLPVTSLLADVQQSVFDAGLIQRYGLGARQYVQVESGTLFLTGWSYLTIDENDNSILGWVASATRRFANGVGAVAGFGIAPEDAEGRTIVTQTTFAGLRLPVGEETRLYLDLAHENVVGVDSRVNVAIGMSFSF